METYDVSTKQDLKKLLIQQKIIEILKDDYIPQGLTIAQVSAPPPFSAYPQGSASYGEIKNGENPKSMVQDYFDNKKE